MKISRRWLGDFLPPKKIPDSGALSALLTGRGIEIESVRPLAARGLRAGEIVSAKPHPNAPKLRVCEVNAGRKTPARIVCGAPNAEPGMLAVLAPPGAHIGGNPIQAREFRGVVSRGMLCSAAEIGIGGEDGGIMALAADEAEPGMPLDDYLHLPDAVLDAGITPNRGDCLSHLGIAREIAAAANLPLQTPQETHRADSDDIFPAESRTEFCPYYCCIVIRGADAARPAPWRIRALLARCGMRSINAAVDITNYVMAATGQPLHAFDLDKLRGGIHVRMAQDGETLALLDGQTVRCRPDTVVIADEGGAVALGGVMGGMDSAVSAGTKNILLEGAFFAPAAVRGKSARHGLSSEAAFRYERGADPAMPPRALALAARLLRDICGGKAGRLNYAGAPPAPAPNISITAAEIRGTLGVADIPLPRAAKLLSAMGIGASVKQKAVHAAPPSWRFDLEQPADLAEEIIRAWGYDKLPETAPPGGVNIAPMPPRPFAPETARRRFAALGFSEIITYAFVPPRWEEILNSGRGAPLALQNPISREMSVMRTTLLGGLLDRAAFNFNRKQERMRLFEIGRCFTAGGGDAWEETQPLFAAGIAAGDALPAQWGETARESDFFDLKGALETFLIPAPKTRFLDDAPRPAFLHPQQSANIAAEIGGEMQVVGAAGALHPEAAAQFGFRRPPLAFELRLQTLAQLRVLPQSAELSRFPPVRRDLSVLSSASAGKVLECVRRAAGLPAEDISLFDVYESGNIADEKKCYGVRLIMQGTERNLTEADIGKTLSAVVAALSAAGMQLRQ